MYALRVFAAIPSLKLPQVASHFYSYSFALNPNWTRKYSMQPEIQAYFRSVAEQYRIVEHIRFHSVVEKAEWDDRGKLWTVTILDLNSKTRSVRRAKILVSGVGALSIPKQCNIPGKDDFKGRIFHSAEWDHSFDWKEKDVVVLGTYSTMYRMLVADSNAGNGCSATQFLPIMANGAGAVKRITQFSQQAQYLSERQNPYYGFTFRATMRYVPLAMRLYRAALYWQMEIDYPGFDIDSGKPIREGLKKENEAYVKRMAPRKYWNALIPKTEIGCKRKVLDTEYLTSLHNKNVELIPDDPVERITEDGVRTKSGRDIYADAIVLAIGFATQQMLFPMEIIGRDGLSLNKHVSLLSTNSLQANIDRTTTVAEHLKRRRPSLLRHLRALVPQLLHPHGPQHNDGPPVRHLHSRMPDQLHAAAPCAHHPQPPQLPLAAAPLAHPTLPAAVAQNRRGQV